MKRASAAGSLRCSFCQKNERNVGKLISNPRDYPRAYICDECVAVCAAIIEDDRIESNSGEPEFDVGSQHPWLSAPRASELLNAVEIWIREESLGKDGFAALNQVRTIAAEMALA